MEQNESNYVLIVEDEDSIRLTLRDYLQNKGYEVVVASDGVLDTGDNERDQPD